MDYKKQLGMGKVNSNLTELTENHFNNSVQFDSLHYFEKGAIDGGKNSISFNGEKSIRLYFADTLPMTYIVNIERDSNIALYTFFAPDSNSEFHINCNENSTCEHFVMQKESSSQKINVTQKSNSTYNAKIFQLNGANDSINLFVTKDGENANTNLSGVFFPKGNEKYVINTKVCHNKPNCETIELFRGIADQNGSGSFSGLIYVAKDAQKTSARQQNRNILLSKDAHVHSEPQLEIYADDVICNHGSSTGQIDEEALWYMQARGIDKTTAMKLLVAGFANDVLQQITNEQLQNFIADCIDKKLQE